MFYLMKKLFQYLKLKKSDYEQNKKDIEQLSEKIKKNIDDLLENKKTKEDFLINDIIKDIFQKRSIKNLKNCEKKYLIIADDNYGIVSTILDYIEIFRDELNLNNIEIKTFSGKTVSSDLLEFIKDNYECIEYAIIDITLNQRVQFNENAKIILDGIDIAIIINELKKRINKDLKFIFYTGNILNPKIDFIKKKIDKFEAFFKDKNIYDYIIQKDFLKSLKDISILFKKLGLKK